MAYKTIDETFWTDPDVRSMSYKGKLLFLYLVTNPHCHYSGLYYLPEMFIQIETGLPLKDIKAGLQDLTQCGFIKYDSHRSVVWIIKMARYQIKGGASNKDMMKGVANHFKALHKTPLIKDFSQYYNDFEVPLDDDFVDSIGTPEDPLEAPLTPPAESGEGRREKGEGEEKHIAREEKKTLFEKQKISIGSLEQKQTFGEFWDALPERNGKKLGQQETYRRFCLLSPDKWPLLIQAAKNYAASQQVKDGVGIRDPKNFIGNDFSEQPWKDWIEPEKKQEVDTDARFDFLKRDKKTGGDVKGKPDIRGDP